MEIDAPIGLVWEVMLDTGAYAEWNPFIVRCIVRADCTEPAVGEPIKLHVRWANGRGAVSPERISVVEPPARHDGVSRATLAYVYEGIPAKLGLVRGTRFQRLCQPDARPTTYATVEMFTGPLVRLAGPARVEDGFRRHAQALKERAEQLAGGARG